MKNNIPQMKIKLDGINAKLDTADEISQLEHTIICTIQNSLQGGKKGLIKWTEHMWVWGSIK